MGGLGVREEGVKRSRSKALECYDVHSMCSCSSCQQWVRYGKELPLLWLFWWDCSVIVSKLLNDETNNMKGGAQSNKFPHSGLQCVSVHCMGGRNNDRWQVQRGQ